VTRFDGRPGSALAEAWRETMGLADNEIGVEVST
jgi:hypothetical protein